MDFPLYNYHLISESTATTEELLLNDITDHTFFDNIITLGACA